MPIFYQELDPVVMWLASVLTLLVCSIYASRYVRVLSAPGYNSVKVHVRYTIVKCGLCAHLAHLTHFVIRCKNKPEMSELKEP